MATATTPTSAPTATPPGRVLHRFRAADYYRMLEAGILHEDDRVELLGGQVVEMSPSGPLHAATTDRTGDVLAAATAGRALVRRQNPLDLGEWDAPEPDLAVVRPRADYYAEGHPTAADVFWLVEVADSSVVHDQRTKAALYAAAGIREVWVVNVPERVLEIYRAPGPPGYEDRQTHHQGERVAPLAFPELQLAVADLLPPGGPERAQEQEAGQRPREQEQGPGRGPELELER
jgi:Uma2 family endonuclease